MAEVIRPGGKRPERPPAGGETAAGKKLSLSLQGIDRRTLMIGGGVLGAIVLIGIIFMIAGALGSGGGSGGASIADAGAPGGPGGTYGNAPAPQSAPAAASPGMNAPAADMAGYATPPGAAAGMGPMPMSGPPPGFNPGGSVQPSLPPGHTVGQGGMGGGGIGTGSAVAPTYEHGGYDPVKSGPQGEVTVPNPAGGSFKFQPVEGGPS